MLAGVDPQDRLAAGAVREGDGDLPVEAAGPKQGRVEDVRSVGRGEDDDARLVVEAVHLDEQLVERLLALVVAAAEARAALPPDRVDLVDEDDRRSRGLGLREQVADAAGADADEQLHELRGGDAEERHRGLAGDGARQERLARPGRADEQDAARQPRPEAAVLVGLLEELDDLGELRLGLVLAGDVREGDLGPLGVVDACPGPTEPEDARPGSAASGGPGRRGTRTSRTSGRTLMARLSRTEPPPVSFALITTPLLSSSGRSAGSSIGGRVDVKFRYDDRRGAPAPDGAAGLLRRPVRRRACRRVLRSRCGTSRSRPGPLNVTWATLLALA